MERVIANAVDQITYGYVLPKEFPEPHC